MNKRSISKSKRKSYLEICYPVWVVLCAFHLNVELGFEHVKIFVQIIYYRTDVTQLTTYKYKMKFKGFNHKT